MYVTVWLSQGERKRFHFSNSNSKMFLPDALRVEKEIWFWRKCPMSNSLFLPTIVSFKIRQRRKNILLERSMDLLHTSPPFNWTELIPCYYFQGDGNKPSKPFSLLIYSLHYELKASLRGLPIYTEAAWLPVSFPHFN